MKSCNNCRNRLICIVYHKITEITPLMSAATFNTSIGDFMKETLGKHCKIYSTKPYKT